MADEEDKGRDRWAVIGKIGVALGIPVAVVSILVGVKGLVGCSQPKPAPMTASATAAASQTQTQQQSVKVEVMPPVPPPPPEPAKPEPPPRAETPGRRHKAEKDEESGDQNIHIGSISGGSQQFNKDSPGAVQNNYNAAPAPQLMQGEVTKNEKKGKIYRTMIRVTIISPYPVGSITADVRGGHSITGLTLSPYPMGAAMTAPGNITTAGGTFSVMNAHGELALSVFSKEPEQDLDVRWSMQ